MASTRCSAWVLESCAGRGQLRLFVYHETVGAIPRSYGSHQRTGHERVVCHGGRAWWRSCERRGLVVRRTAAKKRSESLSGCYHRSTHCEQVWPGHDIVIHSTWG